MIIEFFPFFMVCRRLVHIGNDEGKAHDICISPCSLFVACIRNKNLQLISGSQTEWIAETTNSKVMFLPDSLHILTFGENITIYSTGNGEIVSQMDSFDLEAAFAFKAAEKTLIGFYLSSSIRLYEFQGNKLFEMGVFNFKPHFSKIITIFVAQDIIKLFGTLGNVSVMSDWKFEEETFISVDNPHFKVKMSIYSSNPITAFWGSLKSVLSSKNDEKEYIVMCSVSPNRDFFISLSNEGDLSLFAQG